MVQLGLLEPLVIREMKQLLSARLDHWFPVLPLHISVAFCQRCYNINPPDILRVGGVRVRVTSFKRCSILVRVRVLTYQDALQKPPQSTCAHRKYRG